MVKALISHENNATREWPGGGGATGAMEPVHIQRPKPETAGGSRRCDNSAPELMPPAGRRFRSAGRKSFTLASLLPLALSVVLLSACSTSDSSVGVNARRAAFRLAGLNFAPNTRPLIADGVRESAAFLKPYYEAGRQARREGLTARQAEQRINSIISGVPEENPPVDDLLGERRQGAFDPACQKMTFINRTYAAEQPEKQAAILREAAVATFMDGYSGRP